MNAYEVWLKGKKAETICVVKAGHKDLALIRLATRLGVKSYQCDGRLWKRDVNRKTHG